MLTMPQAGRGCGLGGGLIDGGCRRPFTRATLLVACPILLGHEATFGGATPFPGKATAVTLSGRLPWRRQASRLHLGWVLHVSECENRRCTAEGPPRRCLWLTPCASTQGLGCSGGPGVPGGLQFEVPIDILLTLSLPRP